MTRKRYTIEDMQRIAEEIGGKCLSNSYENCKVKLQWQCIEGHIWMADPDHIIQKKWCPICAKRNGGLKRRLKIEEMHELAKKYGGKCLSTEYHGNHISLKWQCSEGHIWEAMPSHIKHSGSWCPICVGHKPLTIEDLIINATAKGGKCLSSEYLGNATKLHWQCKEGHTWWAAPRDIRAGRWCLQCSGNAPHTLDDAKELAIKRGGECLSTEYQNSKDKLKWKCCEGHVWETDWSHVNRGHWCPTCGTTLSENICRGWFKAIFGVEFKKIRPAWLINLETLKRMELDGFNADMKLAFEYQGEQHTHPLYGEEILRKLKQRDKWKKTICTRNHVTLIEIPYNVTYEDMGNYIVQECKKKGISTNVDVSTINYLDFDVFSKKRLAEMQQLAIKRGGLCLSNIYHSTDKKMKWQCKHGHEWEARPRTIVNGHWCPYCSGRKGKYSIELMHDIAKNRGGKCLSNTFVNIDSKLKWQCNQGHIWESTPYHVIKRKQWCRVCAGSEPLTIEEMNEIALQRGGKCLSKKYVNGNVKLKWQCSEGHIWEAVPSSVKGGSWCQRCKWKSTGKKKRISIEEIQKIVAARKGVCLSIEYAKGRARLKMKCNMGHEWETTSYNIKKGTWCPICAGTAPLTIEEMHEIASKYGGLCLSTKYKNAHVKLRWCCAKGHEWDATATDVKHSGKWCPVCSREKRNKK